MIRGNINRFLRGCSDHRDQLFCLFELKKLPETPSVRPVVCLNVLSDLMAAHDPRLWETLQEFS